MDDDGASPNGERPADDTARRSAPPVGEGTVLSVNVGRPRDIGGDGRRVRSAIGKHPVSGPVRVEGVNLAGDDQADRRVHGGPAKAVYAYAAEDYAWWAGRLGHRLAPGTFGENLTLEGIDLHACVVGETWAVGSARLRVTEPRTPCFKLGLRMGDAGFVDDFGAARRFGAYFAIEAAGEVAAGDIARRLRRPADAFTIAEFISAIEDRDTTLLARLADNTWTSDAWRRRAARAVARHR